MKKKKKKKKGKSSRGQRGDVACPRVRGRHSLLLATYVARGREHDEVVCARGNGLHGEARQVRWLQVARRRV